MPGTDLELLGTVAREAGDIACRYWREDPQVWDKGGDDPVSEADLAVNTHLKERLLSARPDYGWVSEETEDDLSRLDCENVLLVDPIDGTRAFVAGERTWAHSIAVAKAGEVVAACVYLPVHERMYLAKAGAGATLNGKAIRATSSDLSPDTTLLTPKATLQTQFWQGKPPRFSRHFRPSLAYRLALVAQGRFDGMLTLRPTWEWDIAAGSLLVKEAGAEITDRHGEPLAFNSVSRQSAGVVAAGKKTHASLIEHLA